MRAPLRFILTRYMFEGLPCRNRHVSAAAVRPKCESVSSSFDFSSDDLKDVKKSADIQTASSKKIYLKASDSTCQKDNSSSLSSSVSMPMSFMTGSIVGKRFYNQVTTREADDGNGWTVMLDYRTLKTPYKRPLKLPTLPLAMAIAVEWECQQADGIRPFTMPLMKLACTAFERVPLTRAKIIGDLMNKFHQDLLFCRAPEDNDVTKHVLEQQVKKIDPLLNWVESIFGVKPVVYSSFYGGKQDGRLVEAVENHLKNTDDYELAALDALAAAAHSLIVAVGIFLHRLTIEEAIELIRLEEDLQVDRWGLVEGGHDVDVADLSVQISSATVLIGLSRKF